MSVFAHSKRVWLVAIPVFLIAAYLGWYLAYQPDSLEGLGNGTAPSPTETSDPIDEETTESGTQPSDPQESDSTGSSTADGIDDFGACNAEAEVYCSGFYTTDWATWAEENGYTSASWKLGLVDCLGQNEDQLSQACLDSMGRRQELNDAMNTACATDRAQYCKGVVPSPGSEPQVDCLKEHYDELSESCAEALDAHEEAKPLEE